TGRVHRDDADAPPAAGVLGGQSPDQRALARAGRAGDADDVGVAGAGVDPVHNVGQFGAAVVGVRNEPGQRPAAAGQHFVDQGRGAHRPAPPASSCTSRSPMLTVSPSATATAFTLPATGALISFSSFMAVNMTSTSPASTWSPTSTSTSVTVPGMGAATQPSAETPLAPASAAGGGGEVSRDGAAAPAVDAPAGLAPPAAASSPGDASSSSTMTSWRTPSTVTANRRRRAEAPETYCCTIKSSCRGEGKQTAAGFASIPNVPRRPSGPRAGQAARGRWTRDDGVRRSPPRWPRPWPRPAACVPHRPTRRR